MKIKVFFNELDTKLEARFIQTNCPFKIDFNTIDASFETELNEKICVGANYDYYTGDYFVIPRVYQQFLNTKEKVMSEKVTVDVIPLAVVQNPSNGYTATIG